MSTSKDVTSDEHPKVVIRDRRRIDPETGAPRQVGTVEVGESEAVAPTASDGAAGAAADAAAPAPDPVAATAATGGTGAASDEAGLAAQLAERTADLQRVTAEYANYRKRVDRDRQRVTDQATGAVLTSLLPVLDDVDRARAHGDLTGAFAAVAEQVVGTLTKFGLTGFGEVGDPFDPTVHEAVSHTTSPDVSETACIAVLRRGYTLNDRLLRAAMVAVADPDPDAPPTAGGGEAGSAGGDADPAGATAAAADTNDTDGAGPGADTSGPQGDGSSAPRVDG